MRTPALSGKITAMWKRREKAVEESVLLDRIRELCDELERPLRFLSDLEVVLPELSEEERASVLESRPYRERHHAAKAAELIAQLEANALRLRSRRTRHLRDTILNFAESWQYQEPDQLKVIIQLVPRDAA